MLTTNQKGAIAETAIAHAAVRRGIEVHRPVAEGGRFDLMFAFADASLARVQCKWAPLVNNTVAIRAYSARRAREGMRYRSYTAGEIDAIAAYCPDTDAATTCHSLGSAAGGSFTCGSTRREITRLTG